MSCRSKYLLVLLPLTRDIWSKGIRSRRPRSLGQAEVDPKQNSHQNVTIHNATIDCGENIELLKNTSHWQRDSEQLAQQGYTWSLQTSGQQTRRKHENISISTHSLRDVLDYLDHMCESLDSSRACLKERGIRDYCLTITDDVDFQIVFQFICHRQRRDENLVRSLQCLLETRAVTMLYYHIAIRCDGMGILDDLMVRVKQANMYNLDINPVWWEARFTSLYVLPKHVVSTCVRYIVEEH